MQKKHILVVSQYFYPEKFRINDICKEWVKRGYKITVLTGIPNYPKGKYYKGYHFFSLKKERFEGAEIIRIPLIARGSNSITLVLNYFSFVISGWFWKVFSKLKPDLVFIYEVSPMTQALPGVWFARRRKIPCYLYVTDLWPESVVEATGIQSSLIINPLKKMMRFIYKNCQKIFISSEGFTSSVCSYKIEKEKIQFWPQYAEEFYRKVKPIENKVYDSEYFSIIFTGNIGESQGLDILPKVAKRINEDNLKVRFYLIGDGRYRQRLEQRIAELNVERFFHFIGQQPPEEIPYYLANSKVALISLRANALLEKVIPAKLQSYLACGMPILASASGEIQSIIERANCGFSSEAGDVDGLFQNIQKMMKMEETSLIQMGENARNYYESHFDKKLLMDQIDEYLGEINV